MTATLLTVALLWFQTERVVDVRVQGNTLTADADIVRMAAVAPGTAFTATLLDDVTARLKAAGRFERVEVVKRYASIADPSQVLIVIIVDEGRVVIQPMQEGQPARAVRRRGPPLMFLPLLGSADGYGFTYGALVSMPNAAGPRTRVSLPLTWGGERHGGAELEKRFDTRRFTRLTVGGSMLHRENRALDATDARLRVWVRGERELARALRVGAWSGLDRVTFAGERSRVVRSGVDGTIDTRVDPMLSRNAVYVHAAVERLGVRGGVAPWRTLLDASGYVGGPGASTVVARVYRDGASDPVPGYLQVLRGRDSTLRGFRAGTAAGDTTAAGTLEVRVPVTSPLSVGKLGVRAFIDAATVYDAGQRLRKQHFERGAGGGVWFTATVIRFAVDVAHGSGGSTGVQVSSGLLF
ncbi:MAG TPA: BamA/TamA family outer membrane protein [Vicinamibacterales bacterium]|nr:BamA/TamA family outer membrane protein [Vicinamibacterales bacterium]